MEHQKNFSQQRKKLGLPDEAITRYDIGIIMEKAVHGEEFLRLPLPLVYKFPNDKAFAMPFYSKLLKDFVIGMQIGSAVFALKQLSFAGIFDAEDVLKDFSLQKLGNGELYLGFSTMDHLCALSEFSDSYAIMAEVLQDYGLEIEAIEDVFYLVGDSEFPQRLTYDCVNFVSQMAAAVELSGHYKAFCEIREKPNLVLKPVSFVDSTERFQWRKFFDYFNL